MVGGSSFFCFQAEDGIRDLVRSRGLGDVYKRQDEEGAAVRLHVMRGAFLSVANWALEVHH